MGNRFYLSQRFDDRSNLRRIGPMIRAEWRVTPESEGKFKAQHMLVPAPVRGFMVVDTGFLGIGIDSDVAHDLDLQLVGETMLQGLEEHSTQPIYLALLLMPLGIVQGEDLAVGGEVKALCLPRIRDGYDARGLTSPGGEQLRVIGVLGREFLQFTKFTYDGLNGSWNLEIDQSAMSFS